jgi:hypothetical protein
MNAFFPFLEQKEILLSPRCQHGVHYRLCLLLHPLPSLLLMLMWENRWQARAGMHDQGLGVDVPCANLFLSPPKRIILFTERDFDSELTSFLFPFVSAPSGWTAVAEHRQHERSSARRIQSGST